MTALAIDPTLERAVAENPEDQGAWLVLEDWLMAQSDPLGHLAELQRLGDRRRLDEERHHLAPVLLGPQHARLERTLATSLWRGGFVRRAHLFAQPYEVPLLLSSFLASPAARFLSQLHVAEAASFAVLSTIARAPLLRDLRLRVADPINRSAEPAVADLDVLAPLAQLESLHLDNAEALAGGHPRVQVLNLSTRRPVVLAALVAKLPALESLDVACLELAHDATRIAAWPALWHLGIQVDTCGPDPLAPIVRSGLLAQLDRLRISDCEPSTVPPPRGMWPKRRVPIELDEGAKRSLRGGVLAQIERVYLAPPLVLHPG